MFTGIVEAVGTVTDVQKQDASASGGNGYSLTIGSARDVLGDCHLGDSINTSGVCLTVTEFDATSFKVGIAPETLDRSNLGTLTAGGRVNLERAVAGHTRFGGHIVQGHVDTVAEIVERRADGNSVRLTFQPRDPAVMQYIVEKGFIALDGTSLTITAVDDLLSTFSVMLIAYTQDKVVLGQKQQGDLVNVEVDLTGKLVEKQVHVQVEKMLNDRMSARLEQLIDERVSARVDEILALKLQN